MNRRTWTLPAACVGLVLSGLAGLGQAAPALDEGMRAALQDRVDNGELASVVVAIIDGSDTAVLGFGRKGRRAPDARTVYEIGSLSKTFTGLLLADAVKSGRVTLDQPVAALLPGVPIASYQGRAITLLDLATHRSGLPRIPANLHPARIDNPYAGYGRAELKAFFDGYQPGQAPGTAFAYSNLGYGLLGQALSESGAKSYDTLVRERIAGPLGMRSTGVLLSTSMRERLAPGHNALGTPVANWDFDALAGAGALRSDATDMLLYVRAMMRAAPDSAFALARTGQRPAGRGQIALGWLLNEVRGVPVVWHNGMTGGYASFAGFSADGRRGVVLLANSAASLDKLGMDLLVPGAAPEPKRIVLAQDELASYAGRYQLAPGVVLGVKPRAGCLVMQASGQEPFITVPSAKDAFFARSVDIRFSFQRDAGGAVESVVLHQNGRDTPARKLAGLAHPPLVLDGGALAQFLGAYALPNGVALAITAEGGQLFGQVAGQERFALQAFGADAFFHGPDAIELMFRRDADGKVDAVAVRQDGGLETIAVRRPR